MTMTRLRPAAVVHCPVCSLSVSPRPPVLEAEHALPTIEAAVPFVDNYSTESRAGRADGAQRVRIDWRSRTHIRVSPWGC